MIVPESACKAHAKATAINVRLIFKNIIDNLQKEQSLKKANKSLPNFVSYDCRNAFVVIDGLNTADYRGLCDETTAYEKQTIDVNIACRAALITITIKTSSTKRYRGSVGNSVRVASPLDDPALWESSLGQVSCILKSVQKWSYVMCAILGCRCRP